MTVRNIGLAKFSLLILILNASLVFAQKAESDTSDEGATVRLSAGLLSRTLSTAETGDGTSTRP